MDQDVARSRRAVQNRRTTWAVSDDESRENWLVQTWRSPEGDKGNGCICPRRMISRKLGNDRGRVSIVCAHDGVRIGGTRNPGHDQKTRCLKQVSRGPSGPGSPFSPGGTRKGVVRRSELFRTASCVDPRWCSHRQGCCGRPEKGSEQVIVSAVRPLRAAVVAGPQRPPHHSRQCHYELSETISR